MCGLFQRCFGKNTQSQISQEKPVGHRTKKSDSQGSTPASGSRTSSLPPNEQIKLKLRQVEVIYLNEVRDVPPLKFTSNEDDKFRTFKTHLRKEDYLFKNITILSAERKVVRDRRCALIRVGSRDDALTMHRELSKTRWKRRYREELSICYQVEIELLRFRGLSRSDPNEAGNTGFPHDSLCGTLASVGASGECVTIGGIVKHDGKLWALTAQHDRAARDVRREATRANLPSGGDASEYPPIDELEPAWIIEAPRHPQYAPEPPASSGRSGQAPPLKLNKDILNGDEWALASIDDPELYLPNKSSPATIASAPTSGSVRVRGGISGEDLMVMLPSEAYLRTPSGSWIRTWRLKPNGSNRIRIQDGDSGSWVSDPSGKTVYGMVIASLPHTVYVLPLRDVYFNGKGIELASDDEISVAKQMELAAKVLEESKRASAAAKEVYDATSAPQQQPGAENVGRRQRGERMARRRRGG
ncbi:hypothetical protein QBC47DRAFT_53500 [Echria macrotheca]|uniref:Uncharacterized protein n=1 Tax=Echria macrotheca TaxID=438768 RepID=A0AAJ0BAI4_9PEZI|nr:hypothetical protein QBC47DRAFT_53500 [Echria macrotheca]